ncbi:conjugal transfer protein TraG N-terminal domain-containing protein, partial [Vibrio harveyi]|uniref:conjugal transfer protein TraG N-terminal domain-containing protein n=1 Tax=Vibrio harveyi TaxID=669 RepID=UPI003BB517AC
MKGKNISLALLALMMSKPALALDFEYHTRAGFSAIVNAFTGASLMFNDKLWMTLLFVVVVLGCMVAAGSNVWQTMTNIGSNDNKALSLNWLMALFLGSAVMVGLVFPKSRMYIYDDVTNQTYTVGNVPLLVGFLAGGFNSAQTGFSTLIRRNRGTVQDSTKFADGLMLNLMNTSLDKTLLYRIDPDLEINIKEYYNKCVEPAKSLNYVSHKELKQTTNDILSVFGKAKTDHWYMEWNGTAAAGQSRFSTVSCSDAYSRIKTALTPNSPTMNALTESICSKNHFSPTKAVAFQTCKSKLDETARGVFNSSSNGSKMIVNGILANSIRESLMDRNVRTIADRNMVQDGIVSFDTTSLWIDNIKANFIVIILALSPLVALLIPTVIGGRALKLLVAMWLFIFIWGVCDDMLYYAALDQAAVALEDLDSMSVSSMWTAPNDALKALAILGESRSSAMQLSVMVCSMLFGISAYALGGIAQRSMSNVDQNSDKISDEMKTENVGGAMDNVTSSLTAQAIHDEHGIGEMSNAGIYDRQSNLGRASSAIDLRGGEAMGAGWADGSASGVESNRQAQATEKNIDAAGGAENYTASASSVDSGNVMGNIQAVSDAANDNGISIGQQATNTSHTQGTEQQVNAEKTQELVDALSEGNGVSNHAAHKQKVDVDRASETANVEVYQGNDQTPVSTSSISKQHGDADAAKTGELATQVGGMDNLVDLNRAEQQAKANIYGADSQDAVFTSQTQQEHGQAQAKLLDERAGKYGGMDEVVKADNANSLAQDEAYEHDASRAVTDKTNQQTESVARNEQKYSELSSNDINPAQSGVTQGTIDAAHIAGQKEGLEVVGSDAVQAQSAVNTVRGASAGQAALDAQDDGLQGVKDTQSTLTEHESLTQQADADKWNYLTDTLGLDKEQIAQAESGANMHWAVTPDMANDLLEKGVISSRQAEFINDNDGGRLDFSMGKEGEGFAISTSKAATGDSLSADNSTHESDAVTQDTSYNFASTEAANDFLHDAKAIQNAYEYVDGDEAEFSRIVANAGEKVMSNYYSSTEQETGTFSTEGGASIGNKGGGIFGISAGMHASHDEQNIESINAHTADYLQAPRRFAQEAEAKGLKGDEREEYIADKIVSFHANKENEAQDKVLRDKDPSSETEVAELRPEIVNAGSAWGAAGYKDFESRQPRSLTDYSDGANDNKGDKQEVPGGEHSSRGAQADAGQPQQ